MLFQGQSVIVKDIRQLQLRPEVTEQARTMIEEIELPVSFWVNAERDKNYTAPHPQNPNQFWIIFMPGTTQGEMERLTLSGLLAAIRHRRRDLVAVPADEQLQLVRNAPEAERRLQELMGEINSFASALESELYLAQFGIHTAQEVKSQKFSQCQAGLLEYLSIQKNQPFYHWYRENEATNLIGFAACSRFDPAYNAWFRQHILLARPKRDSWRYHAILCALEEMIGKVRTSYDGTNGAELVAWVKRETVRILQLESVFSFRALDVWQSVTEVHGETKRIYSFFPDDFDHRRLALRGLRAANEGLGLFREVIGLNAKYPIAKKMLSCQKDQRQR